MRGYIFAPRPFYGSLKIRKGCIHELTSEREPSPSKIKTLILPGFISTHVHTVQTHARNQAENLELLDWLKNVIWPFEAALTSKAAYASAFDGMRECIENGITTVLDMATTRHTSSVFQAAEDSGIRAFIGKALMDQGPRNLVERNPLPEVFALLEDWHKKDNERLQVSLSPRFAISCSEDLLKKVGTLSRSLKLLHHTHASENLKECEWIQNEFNLSNIEFLDRVGNLNERTIIAHAVHLSKKDVALLNKRRVAISHCPTSNLKLASGIADIKSLRNLKLSLGVDGAACNNRLDPFFEMRLAHLLSRSVHGLAGVTAKTIFEMATQGGARALHSQSRLGSLERGKAADVVIVRVPERVTFNPNFPYESLLHSIQASDIFQVYIAGRLQFTKS